MVAKARAIASYAHVSGCVNTFTQVWCTQLPGIMGVQLGIAICGHL